MSEYSKTFDAKLVSVHVGKTVEFIKESMGTAHVELDGFVGDKHKSYMRGIYEGEAYPGRSEGIIVSGRPSQLKSLKASQKRWIWQNT